MKIDVRAFARKGAAVRLQEITEERAAIRAAFPGILEPDVKAQRQANMAKARAVLAAKRRAEKNGG